ncbi:hypothetical protein MTR67_019261 [Solanum verrucosum]|uniref:DUF7903 domain-containing protein n=1 Tax=Solanum verrucosum TaxID=315347 RepID=A0AAF0QMB0_SOLVR|nr:hypothetical protein MTR67_019261 [Solanum verrucosum]
MAYIPPHKRQTKGFPLLNPTPARDFLTPNNFRKSVNLKSFGEQINFRGKTIVYRKFSVSKWFFVGLADYSRFSSVVSLQPFSADYFDGNPDRKALSLVLMEGCSEGMPNKLIDTPWPLVAANVKEDLLLAFQHMKREMAQVKPSVVARFGKVLFYRRRYPGSAFSTPLIQLSTPESVVSLFVFRRTRLCCSFGFVLLEHRVVEKLGLEYVKGKELYNIRIELNSVRYMVADMSCLGKSSDLRLILYTKKINIILSDEQINGIKDLIGSAVLDSEVQGGLRWPIGKDSSGGRYAVIGIGHTTEKSYRNSSIRFKLWHADPFDFKSSTGEVTQEIFLKMPGIISELRVAANELIDTPWLLVAANVKEDLLLTFQHMKREMEEADMGQ